MDDCKFGILLVLLTGLHIGALCAIRWENISLSNRTMRVNVTVQWQKDLDGSGSGNGTMPDA